MRQGSGVGSQKLGDRDQEVGGNTLANGNQANLEAREQMLGIFYALAAYVLWGILPVYWKLVQQVPAQEILAHRVVWSFVFMLAILLVTGQLKSFWGDLRQIAVRPKRLVGVIMASVLISVNWVTYIWAVNNNRVIETSLGYYINPLVIVLLGVIVLKERLSLWQIVSFLLALAGVLNLVLHFGSVPWSALVLAVSFGLYGLFKKLVNLGAVTGITMETLFITPVAFLYLSYINTGGGGAFGLASPGTSGLLAGAGIITAVPLILFASGARRLPLSAIGFLQYIAPSIALVLGIFVYHEPFTGVHLASFAIIWTALIIFSLAKTNLFLRMEANLLKKFPGRGGESTAKG